MNELSFPDTRKFQNCNHMHTGTTYNMHNKANLSKQDCSENRKTEEMKILLHHCINKIEAKQFDYIMKPYLS